MSTAQRPSTSPRTGSATARLLAAMARALPDRPFEIELWDGRVLPSTTGAGPRFTAREPAALAYVLRNPGQLGLGRAYVSGLLDVDDIDQVMRLVDHWKPGPIAPADRARLVLAAVAPPGCRRRRRPPRSSARGPPAHEGPRRARRPPPLRRLQRLLRDLPRRRR
jgi:cyclopropane-fatty-acyl-phospholipid synthase